MLDVLKARNVMSRDNIIDEVATHIERKDGLQVNADRVYIACTTKLCLVLRLTTDEVHASPEYISLIKHMAEQVDRELTLRFNKKLKAIKRARAERKERAYVKACLVVAVVALIVVLFT